MSEPKAQLVDPQGNMNLPGMNATGVITATSFDGAGGVVTGLTGSPNLNVGVVTATSFVGDGTGHAANLTGTPNLNLGLTTATSFVGDATGKAAGLTGTPNLNVGLVTATSFVGDVTGDITGNITGNVTGNITGDVTGNITGIAGTVLQGANIHVGVVTATSLYGDGSNLTGIAATNYNTQTVAAVGAATTIDLSAGNVITFNQSANTTVSLANTSEAMDVTLIRRGGSRSVSIATGAVDFDNDDGLNGAADSDLSIGTGVFTFECFVYLDDAPGTGSPSYARVFQLDGPSLNSDTANLQVTINASNYTLHAWSYDGSAALNIQGSVSLLGAWHHIAVVRDASNTITQYVDGVADGNDTNNTTNFNPNGGSPRVRIGYYDGGTNGVFNGKISNLRLLVGTALYTGNFAPPSAELTNITNTELLCCQSTSSTTTAAVGPTLSVNSDPTASAQTITLGYSYPTDGTITWPSSIQWNGGSAPTLLTSDKTTVGQQFQLLTRDSGVTWYGWEPYNNEANKYALWSWGQNQSGELGVNTQGTRVSSPTQIPGTTWSQLAYQSQDSAPEVAIKSDNTLWVWGNNAQGNLGLNQSGPGVRVSSPTQLPGSWSSASSMSSAGIGVKTDGTLWSWGYNGSGSLGLNHPSNKVSSPTQVGTDTTWGTEPYQLGPIGTGACVIKTDGTLWCWGRQQFNGELGQNNVTNYSSPKQVGTGTNWQSIGGAYGTVLATKTDGTLWAWGYGDKGGTAQNDVVQRSSPTQIPGTTWDKMTSYGGWQTVSVLKTDGTLWNWGNNQNGSAGQNNTNNGYSSPVQVPGTTWKQCDRGDNGCVVAVKTDGTLWAWGNDDQGTLGLNDVKDYSSPVQVGTDNTWYSVNVNSNTTHALKSN